MKPWDEAFWHDCADREDYEELEEKLWAETEAKDFYFCFDEDQLVITPADYFDKEGCCWDQTLLIEHLLPNIHEAMEGVYEAENQTEVDLLAKGFRKSSEFDAFVKRL